MGRGDLTLAAALRWLDPPLSQLPVINQKVVDRLLELNPETAAASRGCLA